MVGKFHKAGGSKMRVRGIRINGNFTDVARCRVSYDDAEVHSSEYNASNAWMVNFGSGDVNSNNKYYSYRVRAVVAFDGWWPFVLSVREAFFDCIRTKRTSPQGLEYMDIDLWDVDLLALQLYMRAYTISASTCFMVTFPKLREVFAAAFRDRIIHHWICIRLNPLFEQRCKELGDVSFACRKKFGTKAAIKRVHDGMLRVSGNLQNDAWIFKGDIIGFFMHIRKDLMWAMLYALITEKYEGPFMDTLLWVTKMVVMNNPEKNCIVKSDKDYWKIIDKEKSLFFIPDNMGGPIGNLTTQLFAGYYMSFFDEFVEKYFRGKNYEYTRSVDDFIIICDDRNFLRESVPKMSDFLKKELFLGLHNDKIYFQPVKHGVKFLGNYIHPYRLHIINRTLGRMINRIRGFEEMASHGELNGMQLKNMVNVLNSYMGFLVQTRSYRIRHDITLNLSKDIYKYVYIVNFRKFRIKNKYRL
jgi:RNA-directed DNA polymerase